MINYTKNGVAIRNRTKLGDVRCMGKCHSFYEGIAKVRIIFDCLFPSRAEKSIVLALSRLSKIEVLTEGSELVRYGIKEKTT